MAISFHKMHGLGNDFVVLALRDQTFPIDSKRAIQLADRNTGIGCDQVLVLRKPVNGPQLANFEVWNSDGSTAEQCGNGVRCLGLYLKMCQETPDGPFLLTGPAGNVSIRCLQGDQVQVDMGSPVFAADQIPVQLQAENHLYCLDIEQNQYFVGAVSMGNPHSLLLLDDVKNADISHLGALISQNDAFPEGCNAGFAQIVDRDNIFLRVYERGASETLACGSGACAAMSSLRQANMVSDTVTVTQSGGNLIISWMGGEKPVIMMGPATHVFEGKIT